MAGASFDYRTNSGNEVKSPLKRIYGTKLPSEVVQDLMRKTHDIEYDSIGKTFKGFKVIIPDGTINSMSINEETEEKYGAGCGHYAQAQAVGFYELSTGTFDVFQNF